MRVRMTKEQRMDVIRDAAVKAARKHGLVNLTYALVAGFCDAQTSRHTVKHYFGTRTAMLEQTKERMQDGR